MGRLLVLVALVLVALWLLRKALRGPESAPEARKPMQEDELVRCAHCGLYLPRGEAREAGGGLYCSEEHARRGRA